MSGTAPVPSSPTSPLVCTYAAGRDALFADYERHTLPQAHAAIDRIRDWIGAGERVALTCFELDPLDCHRSRLAAAVVRRAKLEGAVHL